jgi:hypothetical protein
VPPPSVLSSKQRGFVPVLLDMSILSAKHKLSVAMDAYEKPKGPSRETIYVVVFISYATYLIWLVIHRLYLSPIAKFPGPKLAALTRWYEFYYEVVLRGKFSDHITELHKIYGELMYAILYNLPKQFCRTDCSHNARGAPYQRPSILRYSLQQKSKICQKSLVQPKIRQRDFCF